AVVLADECADLLVDAAGHVLDVAGSADLGALPLVAGVDAAEPGGRLEGLDHTAVRAAEHLGPRLRDWIDRITRDDDGLWLELREDAVVAAGGTVGHPGRVRLGDGRALADALVAADTVLARVELTCLDVIDVRVPSSPVVRRAEGCEPTGSAA